MNFFTKTQAAWRKSEALTEWCSLHIIIPSLCQLSHLPFYGPLSAYPPLEPWYLEYENLQAILCCHSIHVLSCDAPFDQWLSLGVVDAARASYLLRWGFFLKTDCTTNVLLVFMPSPFQTPEWLDTGTQCTSVFFFCWGGEGVRRLHGELNAKVDCEATIVASQLGRGKWWSTTRKKQLTSTSIGRIISVSTHLQMVWKRSKTVSKIIFCQLVSRPRVSLNVDLQLQF